MRSTVKNFFQQTKKLINEFNFSEIFKLAKAYFDFPSEMAEMWQMLKSINVPLSYSNILPGYETYKDLNDAYIIPSDLNNLNSQVGIELPNMTFHELLKVVRELYPSALDKKRFLKLLVKDDIQCYSVELKISSSPYGVGVGNSGSYCTLQISYIQEGQVINQIIDLEIISKSKLNYIPGLCIAYKNHEIEQQMYSNEQDILEVLKEIREGKI